jgi:ABC-type phosphate/phosphonate transport system substrate-binding protein
MAIVNYQETIFAGSHLIQWSGVAAGDVCVAWCGGLEFMDKTVQINGSTTSTTSMAGTNDSRVFLVPAGQYDSAVTLTDATTGTAISVSPGTNSPGLFVIKENPLGIFPIVTGLGAGVNIRVTAAKKR